MESKILEIIQNNNGCIYVKTKDNKRKRVLYKDEFGFYLLECKKMRLVSRIENPNDLDKINKYLN